MSDIGHEPPTDNKSDFKKKEKRNAFFLLTVRTYLTLNFQAQFRPKFHEDPGNMGARKTSKREYPGTNRTLYP